MKCIRHLAKKYALTFTFLLGFLNAEVVHSADDPCRIEVRNANDAAQTYRAASRSVGQACTKDGGDCSASKTEAGVALEALVNSHQIMLNTCPTGGSPPPSPPSAPSIPGDLLISEIMTDPFCPGGEWFEVFNPTNTEFELEGLVISEDGLSTEHFIISNSLIIPANGFVVFTSFTGGSCLQNELLKYVYPDNSFFLNNIQDRITIKNGTVVIDLVAYDSTWPLSPGTSLNLNPQITSHTDNDLATNWCASSSNFGSSGDLGTPGSSNDPC